MASNQNPGRPQSTALATKEDIGTRIAGTFGTPNEVNSRLQYAEQKMHLVSPATSCGSLPDGCEVALSIVHVDVANETYDVGGGKRGLAKVALDKISGAAGISWDAQQSGRLDNGSDPHYCTFRSVGTVRHLDGTEMQIIGTKEMDMREGSAQIAALQAKIRDKNKNADNQIREMRLHILAHAETKARLRAIRSIGIRTSYEPKEFAKPFVVAKLMFTGRTEDPELRKMFASKRADAMLGGARALYGVAPAAPPHPPFRALSAPPPVGIARLDFDDDDAGDAPSTVSPSPPARGNAPAPQGGMRVPFGKNKGTPIADVDDGELKFLADFFGKAIADPAKSEYLERNTQALTAVRAELEHRRAPAADPRQQPLPNQEPSDHERFQHDDADDPY